MRGPAFNAYVDESCVSRGSHHREYRVCAALIEPGQAKLFRAQLERLRNGGQSPKWHWHGASPGRKARIVEAISALAPLTVVVSHIGVERRDTERYRRKALETLYTEVVAMEVFDVTLECRTPPQDKKDLAHIVALQGQYLDRRLRIRHVRGGDEPLLWIPDAVLGAINDATNGNSTFFDRLSDTIVIAKDTPESAQFKKDEGP